MKSFFFEILKIQSLITTLCLIYQDQYIVGFVLVTELVGNLNYKFMSHKVVFTVLLLI